MWKHLLVIESPAKAKTIKRYVGPDFKIMASVGHLKDLPVSKLGVDVENEFHPEYVTIKGKGKILKALKSAAKQAEVIYLAPDPDREGEAIAWHIAEELKNPKLKIFRVLINELTGPAIRKAIASPQSLNRDKYESQQARRILDRLVGYSLSPLLWPRVKRGLSAGRVQSVAVRMICDREREIFAFEPREYWSLTAHLEAGAPPPFKASFSRYDGKKATLDNEEQTLRIVREVENETFRVSKVSQKRKRKNPPPPFITSLLQQESSRRLGFSAKKTMSVAQSLYEGVELGDQGQVGLITYMRTDAFRISDDAVAQARAHIQKAFGKDYLPPKPNRYKSRKGAQDAHEAIRPTSIDLEPDRISRYLNRDQQALYALIWKRFIACQMNPAILNQTQADLAAGKATFRAAGSVMVFNGFTVLYEETQNDTEGKKEKEVPLPPLSEGEMLRLKKLEPAQHFTQPPHRYTEATLIKALEENGIGRPSTYAAILANISGRQYVSIQKKRFKPTELGFLVTDLLVQNFPKIMDTAFTARMENDLDKIERGDVAWTQVLSRFHGSFSKDLHKAEKDMKAEVLTEVNCPQCGSAMAVKSGKNGLFLACTGYPACKHTTNFERDEKGRIVVESMPEIAEEPGDCDLCGKPMLVKNGKFGPFFACSGYPECKHTRPLLPKNDPAQQKAAGMSCKLCGSRMVVKMNRVGQAFFACEKYPQCTHTEPVTTGVPCPEKDCDGELVERISKRGRKFYGCSRYPACKFVMWDEPVDEACPHCGTPVLAIKRPAKGDAYQVCRQKGCGFKKPLPEGSND